MQKNFTKINKRRKMLPAFFVALLFIFVSIFSSFSFADNAEAAINKQINYQGKLTTRAGIAVPNSSISIVFSLYTASSGGSAIWTETQSVTPSDGLFSVMLGENTALTSVNFNQTLYLGVKVGTDSEMIPRKKLGAVPAAIEAENAQTAQSATKATNLAGGNSASLLGSIPYQSDTDTTSFVSPNVTLTKKFFTMTGTGTNGAIPLWEALVAGDVGLGNVTNENKATMFTSPTFTGTVAGFTMGGDISLGAYTFTTSNNGLISNLNADLLDGQQGSYYQPLLTNPVTGTGTTNYLPKFTGTSALGNSLVYDNGTNVGIGTTDPYRKLEVSSTTHNYLRITSPGTGYDSAVEYNDGTNLVYSGLMNGSGAGAGNFTIYNGGVRMVVQSNGNVGIGTTVPSSNLDVQSTTAAGSSPIVTWRNGGGVVLGTLTEDPINYYSGAISLYRSNSETNGTVISANGNSWLNGGNVGIGYATGTEITNNKLAVNGSIYSDSTITASGGNSSNWNSAYGWGDHSGHYVSIAPVNFSGADITSIFNAGFYGGYNMINAPVGDFGFVHIPTTSTNTLKYGLEIGANILSDTLQFRTTDVNGAGTWRTLWHAGNLTNPVTGTGSSGYLPKFTGASTIGDSSIFANGILVGIGTGSPNSNGGSYASVIHLNSATTQWSVIHSTNIDTGTGGSNGTIFGTIGVDAYVFNYAAGAIILATNSTAALTLASSGAATFASTVTATNATLTALGTGYVPYKTSGAFTNSPIWTDGTNVGIGTTTPGAKLEVVGNARFDTSGTANTGYGNVDIRGNAYHIDPLLYAVSTGGSGCSGCQRIGIKANVTDSAPDSLNYAIWADASGASLNYAIYSNSGTNYFAGNVGIGTTSPKGILGLGDQTGIIGTAGITLGGAQTSIEFLGSTWANGYGHKIYETDPGNGGVDLRFAIRQNALSWTDAMTIGSNTGNVGIGTTVPVTPLNVVKSYSWPSLSADNGIFTVGGTQGNQLQMGGGSDGTFAPWIQTKRSDNVGASYPLAINPLGGNVGIGTTSPGAKLDVNGVAIIGNADSVSANPSLTLDGMGVSDGTNPYGNYGGLVMSAGSSYTGSARTYLITNALLANKFGIIRGIDAATVPTLGTSGAITSGIADFVIDSAGNVGIGTTSPGAKLDIQQASDGNIGISIGTGAISGIIDAPANMYINANDAGSQGTGGVLAFGFNRTGFTGGTEVMRLLQSGNVGIGTVAPAARLHSAVTANGYDVSLTYNAPAAAIIENWGVQLAMGVHTTGSQPFYLQARQSANTSWPLALNPLGGNVGIGTTTPGNILTIQQTSATDPVADAWTVYSSGRWKENRVPIVNALETINELNPVYFDWKAEYGGAHDLGFIAEEVGVLIPEVVAWEDNGIDAKSIDYARLSTIAIAGVKEMNLNLSAITGTIVPTPGSQEEIFANNFFANIFTRVGVWLGDAENGLEKIFVKEVNTGTLCISDATGAKTCINKAQLDDLLVSVGFSSPLGGGAGGGDDGDVPPSIDDNLAKAMTDANTLTAENYTSESWGTFTGALATAQELPEENEADKIAKITALNDAVARLEVLVVEEVVTDLTAYDVAMEAKTETDYTLESWTTYMDIVNANVVTIVNSQTEVDIATSNITAAQVNLTLK